MSSVNDGITYSFGIFYDEFLEYFKEGAGKTSWVVSILVGTTFCSGPISSAFVNKYGCRAVTMAGAVLATVSMVLSCFAQNVTTLLFTIGIGTGLGFGLIYLPAIVSVTTYFEKKRSLATGIAVCGAGFGTFAFAPVITLLIQEFGWRGAMLITAGIVLECAVCGALFRPLEYEKKQVQSNSFNPLKNSEAKTDLHYSDGNNYLELSNGNANLTRPHSMIHFSIPKGGKSGIDDKYHRNPKNKHMGTTRLASSHPVLITSTQSEGNARAFESQSWRRRPISRPDVFYQGSLLNIPNYRSRSELKKSTEEADLVERRHSLTTFRHKYTDPEVKSSKICCGMFSCSEETKETLTVMMDVSLLKDVIFIIFSLSNFLTSIGFNIPFVYIISKAKLLGLTAEEASWLICIIGASNTVGRIVLGYISDKPWVNRLLVYNLCLTICGVATMVSAFCQDFITLAIYGIVFGFTIGAYVGLTSVILVDLLGIEKLTNAFGLLLLFQGIASLVGPPIAGSLYDALHSYDPGFWVSGATVALSGVVLFVIPPIQRHRAKNNARRTSEGEI
ncbi:uncharacterized protein LOC108736335 isoform X2 [Agrilus planipennis]|uniref:Uncharacterized protein LOC108736335 isoform X2 n=1 Tax=Agrilus planipennis TaxID=224129 RepID=A0A1W4WUP3_AGRPL|nr:uncharacterized protein LOC108736335 isoform X2 [Agrilus planipennis]